MDDDTHPGLGATQYRAKLKAFCEDVLRAQQHDTANADAHATHILEQLGFSGCFDANDKVRGSDVVTVLQKLTAPKPAGEGPKATDKVYSSPYTQEQFLALHPQARLEWVTKHEAAATAVAKQTARQDQNSVDIRDLPANWDAFHKDGGPIWSGESKLRWLEERRAKEVEQRAAVARIVASVRES